MEVHWIDKVEIVRRQIREAVRLFFEARDLVLIHAVIASAHQILFDLGNSKGVRSALKNTAAIKREDLQEYLRSINYPYNFFKHADRDSEVKINIGPPERFTSDFVMDAIVMLQQLTGEIPTEAKVFWFWFVSKYPQEFDNCPNGGPLKNMMEKNLASWDFQTICQFLKFCDIVGEANISLNQDASKAGAG